MFGRYTIYGIGAESRTPYMTRWVFGMLRIHKFHRPDADDEHHDHPWNFWTFPLVSYVEEVYDPETKKTRIEVVKRFRFHYREATYAHRALGAYDPSKGGLFARPVDPLKPVWTIVLTGPVMRKWGFYHKGKWLPWKYFKAAKEHGKLP